MSLRNGSPDPFRTPNPLKQQHSHLAQFVSCSSPFQEFFITTFKFTSNSNFWLSNTRRSVLAKREVKTAQLFNSKFLQTRKHYVLLEYNTKQRFFKIRLSLIFLHVQTCILSNWRVNNLPAWWIRDRTPDQR